MQSKYLKMKKKLGNVNQTQDKKNKSLADGTYLKKSISDTFGEVIGTPVKGQGMALSCDSDSQNMDIEDAKPHIKYELLKNDDEISVMKGLDVSGHMRGNLESQTERPEESKE